MATFGLYFAANKTVRKRIAFPKRVSNNPTNTLGIKYITVQLPIKIANNPNIKYTLFLVNILLKREANVDIFYII